MKYIQAADLWFPDSDTHFSALGRKAGDYQYDRVKHALKFVKNRRLAVDVGAHVGILTMRLAEHFDNVIAFEPCKENFECLKHNLEAYHNADLRNIALSDLNRQLRITKDGSGNSGNNWITKTGPDLVDSVSLDSLKLDVLDLLKLDVQGFEWYVVSGGVETIKRCRPVCIVEVEKLPPGVHFKKTAKDAIKVLAGLGMREVGSIGVDKIMAFR